MSIIYVYTKNVKLPRIAIDDNKQFVKYAKIDDIIRYLWFMVLIKDLKVNRVFKINNIIILKHHYTKPSKQPYFAFKLHDNILFIYFTCGCHANIKYFRHLTKITSMNNYTHLKTNHCQLCYSFNKELIILCYHCQKEMLIHNCYSYRIILFLIHQLNLIYDVQCYIKQVYFRKQIKYKMYSYITI